MSNLKLVNCTMDGKLQIAHEYFPTFDMVNTSKKLWFTSSLLLLK
jgi:hypothetical protein